MLYEVKTSNWGRDIEIFDHNDKSVLKAYYKKKYWYSSYYYLSSEINGDQLEIRVANFWGTKFAIKINNELLGEIFYKPMMNSTQYGITLNGNKYTLKNYKTLLNPKNEMLIKVRSKSTFTKSFFYLETNTDVFKKDVPYLLLITYYMFRKSHKHY